MEADTSLPVTSEITVSRLLCNNIQHIKILWHSYMAQKQIIIPKILNICLWAKKYIKKIIKIKI